MLNEDLTIKATTIDFYIITNATIIQTNMYILGKIYSRRTAFPRTRTCTI